MANPLRDQAAAKYGNASSSNTPPLAGSALREQLSQKYVTPSGGTLDGSKLRKEAEQKFTTPVETKKGTVNVPNPTYDPSQFGPRIQPKSIPMRPGSGFQQPEPVSTPTTPQAPVKTEFKDGKLVYAKGSKTDVAMKILDKGAELSDKFFDFVGNVFFSPVTFAQKAVGANTTYALQRIFDKPEDRKSWVQLYKEAPTAADVVNKGGDAALQLANREDLKNAKPVTLTAADVVHALTKTFLPTSFLGNPAVKEGLNRLADKYGGDIKIIDNKPAYQLAQDLVKFVGDTSLEIGVGGAAGSSLLKKGTVVKVKPQQAADFFTGRATTEAALPEVAQKVLSEQISLDKALTKKVVKQGIEIRITEPTTSAGKQMLGTILGGEAPTGKTVDFFVGGKKVAQAPLTEEVSKQLLKTQFNEMVNNQLVAAEKRIVDSPPTQDLTTFVKERGGKMIKEPTEGWSGLKVAEAEKIATTPLSPTVVEAIQQLSPVQGAAFGRKIIDSVTENLGLRIQGEDVGSSVSKLTSKGETILRDVPASDGRPAQVIDGKIELFLPTLKDDLQKLAQGQSIRAHEGAYTTVYKMKAGESMEQLATRYVSDVILHEQSHLKTMTAGDIQKMQDLNTKVVQAQATRSQPAITVAKTELDNFMRELEDKANLHMTNNKTQLEMEIFGKSSSPVKGANRSFIDKVMGRTPEAEVTKTPSSLLKNNLRAQERVANKLKKVITKGKEVREIQKSLREAIKPLPAKEQIKLLDSIESITTVKQADNFIDRAREVYFKDTRSFKDKVIGRLKGKEVITTEEKLLKMKLKNEEVLGKKIMRSFLKKQRSLEDNRKILRKYAKILPAAERIKVLSKIEKATTNEQAMKIIGEIQRLSNVVERNYLQGVIKKELDSIKVKLDRGLPKNVKYDFDTQKTLEQIKKDVDKPYVQAQLEIQRIGEEWATTHPNELMPPEIVAEIDRLSMQGIEDMTPTELRKVLADIKSLKEQGLTTRQLEKFNRQSVMQQDRGKIEEVLTGGDLSKLDSKTALPTVEFNEKNFKSFLEKTIEGIKDLPGDLWWRNIGLEELLDYMSQFDKGSKPYESFLNRTILPKLRKATNAESNGFMDWSNKMGDLFADAYNLKTKKQITAKYKEMLTQVNLGDVTLLDGSVKPLVLDKAQALQLDMWWQDPTLEKTFTETLKWGDGVKNKLNTFITQEDRAFQEGMFGLYKEHGVTVNEQFVKDFGYEMKMSSERFSSAPRDLEGLQPESVLLAQDSHDYLKVTNGSLRARVQSNLLFKDVNVFQNYLRYMSRMEHYKAFSETMQYLNATLFHPDTIKTMKKVYGPKSVEILKRFGEDIARGGVDRAKIIPTLEKLMNNLSRSFLGLPNVSTPIKQLTGLFNFAISDMPIGTLAFQTAKFYKNPIKNTKFLNDYSDFFNERYASDSFQKDINVVLSNKDPLGALKKQRGNKIDRFLFSGIKKADQATIAPGVWSATNFKYEQLTGKKLNIIQSGDGWVQNFDVEALKESIEYAEDLAQRVQEGSALYQKTDFERSGSLYRLLTMFTSQPNKMMQQFINAGRNYKRGRGSKAFNLKRMSLIGFVLPYIYLNVSNLFQEEKYKDSNKALIGKSLLSPITNTAILGNAVQSAVGWATGEPFDYTISPLQQIMTDLQKTLTNFYIGIDQDKEKNINYAITYLADFLGRIKGVPTSRVTKKIRKNISEQ